MTNCTLMIFTKAPVHGSVKTRLIPTLSPQGATALHRALVRDTLQKAVEARLGPVQLHCAPSTEHPFFKQCARRFGVELRAQLGKDLGTRMANAFSATLRQARGALLVGTDCPALTVEDLQLAARKLEEGADAVLVPAEDGGYALIGLRRVSAVLFDLIPWGGPAVLSHTRARLKALDWRWAELSTRWDVDRPEDLLRLGTLKQPEFHRFVKQLTP